MNLTEENPFPEEPIRLPPARRKRRRYLVSPGDDERAALLENLARRAFPTFEFFLFSLLCGAVLGAGYILDSQSLLLLGVLIAPLMTPWVGLTLASVTGSGRFFLQTLGGLLIGGILVFGGGLLAGLAARIWLPLPLSLADINSHLWWPNMVVLALGAVLLVVCLVRSEAKPFLPSVMLSYELFLPLSAAAFGLGSGLPDAWPNGLLVFLVHLTLATFLGVIVLAFLRFRPATFAGYILAVLILSLTLIVVLGLAGIGTFIPAQSATPTPSQTLAPEPTHSVTPAPQRTSTVTLTPSPTGPTGTITPQPTPVYARIYSAEGGGAIVRSEPGTGVILKSLINDIQIEVLPEVKTYNGVVWVHIRTPDGTEGWVMQMVLVFATPAPYWPPSATP
jgi:MFS family permease